MNIVIIGFKGCGKTTVGKQLAKRLEKKFVDLDKVIEKIHGKKNTFREIYKKRGAKYFRDLENKALRSLLRENNIVLATGGGALLKKKNQNIMKKIGKIVFLDLNKKLLFKRVMKNGVPAFFDKNNPKNSFEKLLRKRKPIYKKVADFRVNISNLETDEIIRKIIWKLKGG